MKLRLIRPPFLVDTFFSLENSFTCSRGKVPPFISAVTPARGPGTIIIGAKPSDLPALPAASQLHSAQPRCSVVQCTGSEMCCSFSTQTFSSTEINFGSLKVSLHTKHCLSVHHLRRKDARSGSWEKPERPISPLERSPVHMVLKVNRSLALTSQPKMGLNQNSRSKNSLWPDESVTRIQNSIQIQVYKFGSWCNEANQCLQLEFPESHSLNLPTALVQHGRCSQSLIPFVRKRQKTFL